MLNTNLLNAKGANNQYSLTDFEKISDHKVIIDSDDDEMIVRTCLNRMTGIPSHYTSNDKQIEKLQNAFREFILDLYNTNSNVLKNELNNSHASFFEEYRSICKSARLSKINKLEAYQGFIIAIISTQHNIDFPLIVDSMVADRDADSAQCSQVVDIVYNFWMLHDIICFHDIQNLHDDILAQVFNG